MKNTATFRAFARRNSERIGLIAGASYAVTHWTFATGS